MEEEGGQNMDLSDRDPQRIHQSTVNSKQFTIKLLKNKITTKTKEPKEDENKENENKKKFQITWVKLFSWDKNARIHKRLKRIF